MATAILPAARRLIEAMLRPVARLTFARQVGLVMLLGGALRLAIRLAKPPRDYWTEGYSFFYAIAHNLRAGEGYAVYVGEPTAFRVPAYPLFIAAVQGLSDNPWRLIAAQWAVSVGTIGLVALLGRRLFNPPAGVLAALLCAIYPYYAWHDLSLQETGLFIFLTLLGTLLIYQLADSGRLLTAAAAGLALALAVLTRETLLPFAVLAVIWAGAMVWRGRGFRPALLSVGAALAVFGLTLTPWLIKAHQVYGEYVLSSEFGRAVFVANHPLMFTNFPAASVDRDRELVYAELTPDQVTQVNRLQANALIMDHYFLDQAIAEIKQDPGALVPRAARKLWIAFSPWPAPRHDLYGDLGYALSWTPVLLLGLAGLWTSRRRWLLHLPIYAHFALFCASTAVIWAQTSHRSYLDVYLMVFAGGFITYCWQLWRHEKTALG